MFLMAAWEFQPLFYSADVLVLKTFNDVFLMVQHLVSTELNKAICI